MKPPPAQEILQSEVAEPILARWHVGLGWSLAWTSDVKNLWAVEWLRWPGYGQFWGQLVREHMRQKKRQQYDMRAEIDAATGHVKASIDAIGGDDRFQNGLDAKLTVTGPQPNGETRKIADEADGARPLRVGLPARALRLVPPARRRSRRASTTARAGRRACRSPRASVTSRTRIRASTSRSRRISSPCRAPRSITGGRMDPDAKAVFDPAGETIRYHQDLWSRFIGAALAVYLLDLLIRRVRIFDRKKTAKPTIPVRRARA